MKEHKILYYRETEEERERRKGESWSEIEGKRVRGEQREGRGQAGNYPAYGHEHLQLCDQ